MGDFIDLTEDSPPKRPPPPNGGNGGQAGAGGEQDGGKRRRTGGGDLSVACARVLEVIPDADLGVVRGLLSDLSGGGNSVDSKEVVVQRVVETLLSGMEGGGAPSAAKRRDRELALSLAREGQNLEDEALARQLSAQGVSGVDDAAVARELLAREDMERDRQLALELDREQQQARDDQVRQPMSACVANASGDARFLAEETSGRGRRDLTDMVAELMKDEVSKHKGVKGEKKVVVCADVEFFGSSDQADVGGGVKVAESEEAVKEVEGKEEEQRYKRKKEGDLGWGCGYRNIQMLSAHMLRRGTPHEASAGDAAASRAGDAAAPCETLSNEASGAFPQGSSAEDGAQSDLPYRAALFGGVGHVVSVTGLQGFIEEAWGRGYDTSGADQLGFKLVGTQKWIGTTEAVSLFRCAGLRARFIGFRAKQKPHEAMWECVKRYFDQGVKTATGNGASFLVWRPEMERSSRPPLYMQHLGHSRTIIGYIEIGHIRQLLVLDPGHSAKALETVLSRGFGWQRFVKRGMHTFKHEEFELIYFDDDGLLPNGGKGPGRVLPRSGGGGVIMTQAERDAGKRVGADRRVGYEGIDNQYRDLGVGTGQYRGRNRHEDT